jgi:GTP-binding protein
MTKPIVAIVGRTNVGKSTLLNRLAGRRLAIVGDLPGITRDRILASTSWQGKELTLIDTGGWQAKPSTGLEQKVKEQVEIAISHADSVIFLVDACDGAIATDEEIADILRAAGKPVILTVNKVDSIRQADRVTEFYRLGIGTPIAISAYHNRGIDELMGAVLASLPPSPATAGESGELKLAIVGRPNVGKSTLMNMLLGEERAIVDQAPRTTRDALDAIVRWDDNEVVLVDTAGIKRRGRVGAGVDYYSLLRALQAINRCDVALLLIDAAEFVAAQDMHIAGYIIEAGKGMVLLVNKWDLVSEEQKEEFKRYLERRLKFISYVPIVFISAKLGWGVTRIMPQAWQVWREGQKRVPNSAVNEVIEEAVASHPPPRSGSKRLRIPRAHQDESSPSTFVLQVNDPELVHFTYRRYLENELRHNFGFYGIPLRLIFTRPARKSNKGKKVVKT